MKFWVHRRHPEGVELIAVRDTLPAAVLVTGPNHQVYHGDASDWRVFSRRLALRHLHERAVRLPSSAPPERSLQ